MMNNRIQFQYLYYMLHQFILIQRDIVSQDQIPALCRLVFKLKNTTKLCNSQHVFCFSVDKSLVNAG
jgi:hypothetical protein